MLKLIQFLLCAAVFFVAIQMGTALITNDFSAFEYAMCESFLLTKSLCQQFGSRTMKSFRLTDCWSKVCSSYRPTSSTVESLYSTLFLSGIASWFYGWLSPILIARLLSMFEEAPTDVMGMKVKNTDLHIPLLPLEHRSRQDLVYPSSQHHIGDVDNFIEVRVCDGRNPPITITRGYSNNADITPIEVRIAWPGSQSVAISSDGQGIQTLPAEVTLNPESPSEIPTAIDLKDLQEFDPLSVCDDEFKSQTSSDIAMKGSDTSADIPEEEEVECELSRVRKIFRQFLRTSHYKVPEDEYGRLNTRSRLKKCHKFTVASSSTHIVEAEKCDDVEVVSERRSIRRGHPLTSTMEATSKTEKATPEHKTATSKLADALSMTESALRTRKAVLKLAKVVGNLEALPSSEEASTCSEKASTCTEKWSTSAVKTSTCSEDASNSGEKASTCDEMALNGSVKASTCSDKWSTCSEEASTSAEESSSVETVFEDDLELKKRVWIRPDIVSGPVARKLARRLYSNGPVNRALTTDNQQTDF